MLLLGQLSLILLMTLFLGQLSTYFHLPAVVGQLLSGLLLGPAILNVIHLDSLLEAFAQLGIFFLMFAAGLESNLKQLKTYFRLSFVIAATGVLLPVILIGAAGLGFGLTLPAALFIGVVFSATSVSISAEVLKENAQLTSRAGTAIFGAAVVDDVLAVIVLSVFMAIFPLSDATPSASSTDLLQKIGLQTGYFVFIWLLFKFLIPHISTWMRRQPAFSGIWPTLGLIFGFGLAWLAETIGLSNVVGAFFGGLLLSQTPLKIELRPKIDTIGNLLFIPVFFASIGLTMTLESLGQDLAFILILTLLALMTKFWAGQWGSRLFGLSKNEAAIVGAGMVSRGEVALIVAQIGHTAHLFPETIYSSLIMAILLTTLISPLLLQHFIKKGA